VLISAQTAEIDVLPAPEPSWSELSNRLVWPGPEPEAADFGGLVGQLQIAARPLLTPLPLELDRIPFAVRLQNGGDTPVAFYAFSWSATAKPARGGTRSVTRRIGIDSGRGATAVLQAGESITGIVYARLDEGASGAERLRIHLNLPTPRDLGANRPYPAHDQPADLISPVLTVSWAETPHEGLLDLLRQAAFREPDAVARLIDHPDLPGAVALLGQVDRKTASRFRGQLPWHPEWQAENALAAYFALKSPYGRWTHDHNKQIWNWVEKGLCGGSAERRELVQALAASMAAVAADGSDGHAITDTYAAVLASTDRLDEAVIVQRKAYALCPEDPAQKADIGGRIVDYEAMAAMAGLPKPPLLTATGFSGAMAEDLLRLRAQDSDPNLANRARKILAESFGQVADDTSDF
jgi:hypothetical protein